MTKQGWRTDYLECIYDPSQQVVRIADQEPRGWVLLRNREHTHLLIEIGPSKDEWKTSFAADPKKVLEHLHQQSAFSSWPSLFSLIRQVHREAHPGKDEKPNLTFLEDLMTKVYQGANPLRVLTSEIKKLDSQPR